MDIKDKELRMSLKQLAIVIPAYKGTFFSRL